MNHTQSIAMKCSFIYLLFALLQITGSAEELVADRILVKGVIENRASPENPWVIDEELPVKNWPQIVNWHRKLKHTPRKGGDRSPPLRALSVFWLEIKGYKNGRETFQLFMPHEGSITTIPSGDGPVTGALVSPNDFKAISSLLLDGTKKRRKL